MNHNLFSKKIYFILVFVFLITISLECLNLYYFPSQIDIVKGKSKNLNLMFPFSATILEDKEKILEIDNKDNLGINIRKSITLNSFDNGIANIQFKLLGLIPLKNVRVNVIDNVYLIPGGQAIGVKLKTKGVLVVALSDIVGIDGNNYSPAKDGGIKIGDSIIEINNIIVKDSNHVMDILNGIENKEVEIIVLRNNKKFKTNIKPVKSSKENSYKLGLWVRDKTAGIGTLTFFHPKTKEFGALGHGITDIDTGDLMPSEDGEIMKAKVSSIQHGKKGTPGEIVGIFFESEDILGKIEKNTVYGIYGTAYDNIKNNIQQQPLPIGLRDEVKIGKAYILTTVDKNKIEQYEIRIAKLYSQAKPSQKSMIIEVVDSELLRKTGGIVQGMSGSPIIQNGKLIGAVTHVFVNDPKKGYGLYIEWMLEEAGITINNNKEFALVE